MFPFFLSHVNDDEDDDGSDEKSRTIHNLWFHTEYGCRAGERERKECVILISPDNPLKLNFRMND